MYLNAYFIFTTCTHSVYTLITSFIHIFSYFIYFIFIFILFSYFRLEQLVRTSPIAVSIVRWERQKNIDFEYCLITDFQNIKIHAKCRSSPPEVFYKKGDLRNFTKFTGKHMCQSLSFNKVADQASKAYKASDLKLY